MKNKKEKCDYCIQDATCYQTLETTSMTNGIKREHWVRLVCEMHREYTGYEN